MSKLPIGIAVTPQGHYQARYNQNDKTIHVGTYDSIDQAVEARRDAMLAAGYSIEQIGKPQNRVDLTGRVFGHLTVLKKDTKRGKHGEVIWICQCDCGNRTHTKAANLLNGSATSCGHVGTARIKKYLEDEKKANPDGTRLVLLGDKASKNSTTGERNISVVNYRGETRYRVAVMYQRKQHGGVYTTLEDAIAARELIREKYWPNYKNSTERNGR